MQVKIRLPFHLLEQLRNTTGPIQTLQLVWQQMVQVISHLLLVRIREASLKQRISLLHHNIYLEVILVRVVHKVLAFLSIRRR